MFLVLLVIASAVGVLSAQQDGHRAQQDGHRAQSRNFYRHPSLGAGGRRQHPDHRRQFVSDEELPTYSDDSDSYTEDNYQPTIAVRAPQQQSRGAYKSDQQRYRSHVPTIEGSTNSDHTLDAQGSNFIPNVEEDTYNDEENYRDVYEDQPEERISVVGRPVVVTGGGIGGGVGVGVGGGESFGNSYGKKDGQGYQHGDHHGKGQKAAKGHKANESYDKGHVEKHGHEHNKGGKKEAFGVKKGHIDEHKGYHKGDAHKKEAKGADKFHSKSHKKGKKTSGSRNLHHKDQFEKNEVFIDEEHDIGHEKIKAHKEGGRHEAKGGASKKGHLNSGYKDAFKGAEGEKKEGHRYGNSNGHSGHIGHKSEEEHGEGFQKAGGHKGQEAQGHYYKKAGGGASLG